MKRANQEIREYAAKRGVYLWEIAQAMGISEPTMTRKLRTELPEDEHRKITQIINEIADAKSLDN